MLFLPFEQRMTRDMKAMRARRASRRSTASVSGKSTLTSLTGGLASDACHAAKTMSATRPLSPLATCTAGLLVSLHLD